MQIHDKISINCDTSSCTLIHSFCQLSLSSNPTFQIITRVTLFDAPSHLAQRLRQIIFLTNISWLDIQAGSEEAGDNVRERRCHRSG